MSLSAEQFQPLQTALPGMLGGGGQGAQHVAGAASAVGPMGHCNLGIDKTMKHVNRDRSLIDLLHMRQSSESWMTFVHDLEGAADLCQLETKPVTRDDLIRVLALAGMKDRNLAETALAEQYTLKTLISTGSRLARHGRRLSGDGKYFYDVLELDKGATDKDIKNAYRSLSRKYHPDKNVDSEDSEENAARMAELGKANAILSDPEQKAVYDKWGSKGIVAGQSLGGLERVNRVTMFICKISGGLPEFV